MRHRKAGVKLGRTGSHRNAMFRNMVTSLIKHGKIKTTDTKAKELRRWADHIVTLAKRGDLHARRQALAIVREKQVVHKLFEVAQEQFGNRAGGYTRLTKLGHRAGDAAPMTLVEMVTSEAEDKKKKKAQKSKQKAATAPVAKEATPPPTGEAVKEEPADAAETEASEDTVADTEKVPEASEPESDLPEASPEESDDTPADDAGEESSEGEDVPGDQPEEDKA